MRFLLFLLTSWSALASCVPPSNNYDWECQDWRARCITNASSVDGSSYVATTTFMHNLKWWDLRKFVGRANVYLGADTNALMCPLIHSFPGGSIQGAAETLVAFVATNYSATGAKCNGSTQYINTGVGAASLGTSSDFHNAVYSRTSIYEVGGAIGSADSAGYINYFLFGWVDNNCYMYFGRITDQLGAADPTPPTGFYLATRTSTTNRFIYKNGSAISTSTVVVAGDAMNGNTIFVHGLNSNNSLNSPTTRELCYYSAGKSFLAAPEALYYKAVQRLQLTRNRAIIP